MDGDAGLDFSILIPTRNRAEDLERLFSFLGALDVAGLRGEVILIANACTDDTIARARGVTLQNHLPLTVLEVLRPGKNAALNGALPMAKGELLLFTDDDVGPSTDWIRRLWEAAGDFPEADIFSTVIEPAFPVEPPDWLNELLPKWGAWFFGHYTPPRRESGFTQKLPYGASMTVRRRVFRSASFSTQIGPNGTTYGMGSETEFLRRITATGSKTVFVAGPVVLHFVRPEQMDRDWLLRRAVNAGRGALQMEDRHKRLRRRISFPLRYGRLALKELFLRSTGGLPHFNVLWAMRHVEGIEREAYARSRVGARLVAAVESLGGTSSSH